MRPNSIYIAVYLTGLYLGVSAQLQVPVKLGQDALNAVPHLGQYLDPSATFSELDADFHHESVSSVMIQSFSNTISAGTLSSAVSCLTDVASPEAYTIFAGQQVAAATQGSAVYISFRSMSDEHSGKLSHTKSVQKGAAFVDWLQSCRAGGSNSFATQVGTSCSVSAAEPLDALCIAARSAPTDFAIKQVVSYPQSKDDMDQDETRAALAELAPDASIQPRQVTRFKASHPLLHFSGKPKAHSVVDGKRRYRMAYSAAHPALGNATHMYDVTYHAVTLHIDEMAQIVDVLCTSTYVQLTASAPVSMEGVKYVTGGASWSCPVEDGNKRRTGLSVAVGSVETHVLASGFIYYGLHVTHVPAYAGAASFSSHLEVHPAESTTDAAARALEDCTTAATESVTEDHEGVINVPCATSALSVWKGVNYNFDTQKASRPLYLSGDTITMPDTFAYVELALKFSVIAGVDLPVPDLVIRLFKLEVTGTSGAGIGLSGQVPSAVSTGSQELTEEKEIKSFTVHAGEIPITTDLTGTLVGQASGKSSLSRVDTSFRVGGTVAYGTQYTNKLAGPDSCYCLGHCYSLDVSYWCNVNDACSEGTKREKSSIKWAYCGSWSSEGSKWSKLAQHTVNSHAELPSVPSDSDLAGSSLTLQVGTQLKADVEHIVSASMTPYTKLALDVISKSCGYASADSLELRYGSLGVSFDIGQVVLKVPWVDWSVTLLSGWQPDDSSLVDATSRTLVDGCAAGLGDEAGAAAAGSIAGSQNDSSAALGKPAITGIAAAGVALLAMGAAFMMYRRRQRPAGAASRREGSSVVNPVAV